MFRRPWRVRPCVDHSPNLLDCVTADNVTTSRVALRSPVKWSWGFSAIWNNIASPHFVEYLSLSLKSAAQHPQSHRLREEKFSKTRGNLILSLLLIGSHARLHESGGRCGVFDADNFTRVSVRRFFLSASRKPPLTWAKRSIFNPHALHHSTFCSIEDRGGERRKESSRKPKKMYKSAGDAAWRSTAASF